jgi:hypothetical protein
MLDLCYDFTRDYDTDAYFLLSLPSHLLCPTYSPLDYESLTSLLFCVLVP